MTADRRYVAAAVALHWTIAGLILFQIAYAWWVMAPAPDHSARHAQAMALHMSIGLTVLMLSLARLGVRLAFPPPPLPAGMPAWERAAASTAHILFYVLIIGLPLTGWALASLRPSPIGLWGLAWPHLPMAAAFGADARHAVGHPLALAHKRVLLWTTLGLLALHVAGALRHQLFGAPVLWRMLPLVGPPAGPRR